MHGRELKKERSKTQWNKITNCWNLQEAVNFEYRRRMPTVSPMCLNSGTEPWQSKIHMEVSYNGGTPKSSILMVFAMKSTIQLLGTPHLWKPPYNHLASYSRKQQHKASLGSFPRKAQGTSQHGDGRNEGIAPMPELPVSRGGFCCMFSLFSSW